MTTTSSADNAVSALDDYALLESVRDGDDDEAFARFYARHKPGVLSFSRHILGNREDAEDAVQHTFLAAYRHVQDEGPPAHPSAWLYTVARNRCLTMIRARRESPGDAVEPATAGLAEEVEWRFELRALLRDLSRLPEEQRAALILFELGGLSQTEVGEVLESSPEQVKALVYQARHGLMDRAVARETECREIRTRLATLRGGRLNDRTLRHHLDECAGCRAFRADVTLQRRGLAVVLPVVPLAGFHTGILAALGIGGGAAAAAAGGSAAAAGAAHGGASGAAHAAAPATPAKVLAAGAAVTAVSTALAFALGGHHPQRVPDTAAAAPVAAPAPAPSPAPRTVHRAAAPHRKKRKPKAHPRAAAAAQRPAPRVVAAVPPQRPAATPQPRARPHSPPRHAPPVSKPPPQPAPVAPAPEPAPTAEATPTPVPPTPAPPAEENPPKKNGHRNDPPGPLGNPQPHGPPPGWDPGKSPAP